MDIGKFTYLLSKFYLLLEVGTFLRERLKEKCLSNSSPGLRPPPREGDTVGAYAVLLHTGV